MIPSLEPAGLWFVMRTAAYWCHIQAAGSISKLELGVSDFAVLSALRARGPLRPDAIGKKVLLTSGSVTAALDRLERGNLTERRADPSDGRASLVFLTDLGAELARRANDKHTASMNQIFSVLTEKEQSDLRRLLKKLGKFAQDAPIGSNSSDGAGEVSARRRHSRRSTPSSEKTV